MSKKTEKTELEQKLEDAQEAKEQKAIDANAAFESHKSTISAKRHEVSSRYASIMGLKAPTPDMIRQALDHPEPTLDIYLTLHESEVKKMFSQTAVNQRFCALSGEIDADQKIDLLKVFRENSKKCKADMAAVQGRIFGKVGKDLKTAIQAELETAYKSLEFAKLNKITVELSGSEKTFISAINPDNPTWAKVSVVLGTGKQK